MVRFRQRDPATEQVHQLVRTLALPRIWQRDTFLEQVAALVGKRIRLLPLATEVAGQLPCGLVLERADDVVIAYDATGSEYHADHIILHEVGHLLLAHGGRRSSTPDATVQILFPNVRPETVLRVLHRGDYDDIAERQAELFASLIMSTARTETSESPLRRVLFRD
ncbi:hypothetical protein [Nocardia brasiliensis]|uniref:hypothetical protein n=1 Tax=Nocardia brasiliensis TaxID=37326 RepID=UPI001895C44F|nr:hypothetical protein [Nocardia brasiliensis]MBF6128829.1 hypothetical protein [Nocardia brasiliensis]